MSARHIRKGFTLISRVCKPNKRSFEHGFTLIELLIVIAILGLISVVVLVAINPAQQLARTRDAGRKNSVTQIGHALEEYYTSHSGGFFATPSAEDTWMDDLVTAGEISAVLDEIASSASYSPCTSDDYRHNGLCYKANAQRTHSQVYAIMESVSENSKCTGVGEMAIFVWSTMDGRGGTVCHTATNLPLASYAGNYKE